MKTLEEFGWQSTETGRWYVATPFGSYVIISSPEIEPESQIYSVCYPLSHIGNLNCKTLEDAKKACEEHWHNNLTACLRDKDKFTDPLGAEWIIAIDPRHSRAKIACGGHTLIKGVGRRPTAIHQFAAGDGCRWVVTLDEGSARLSLFQISGTDGLIYDQARLQASQLMIKYFHSLNPVSVFHRKTSEGILICVKASDGSVESFLASGSDWVINPSVYLMSENRRSVD